MFTSAAVDVPSRPSSCALRACCADAKPHSPRHHNTLRIIIPGYPTFGKSIPTYTWLEHHPSYHGPRKDNLPRRKVKAGRRGSTAGEVGEVKAEAE